MVIRPKAIERFKQEAERRGLSPQILEFPEGTKTAADAARAVGCEIGQIVKSLVFLADGEFLVALTSGRNRADTAKLAVLTGAANVRPARPEEAREATGFAIGGTPPFGYPRTLRVFVDPDLLEHEAVWAAAGTPQAMFALTPGELVKASGAERAEFKETKPGG